MENKSVILFHSTNYAVWADRTLEEEKIEHKLSPIPRNLSSDCGYCIKINTSDAEKVKTILINKGVEFQDIINL